MRINTDQLPLFKNKEILYLYEFDFHIPENIIEEILALPRETLILDLHLVLEDAIKRKEIFDDNSQEENEWFPAHAILLLKELKSTESLDKIIDFLQFDYESEEGYVHFMLDEIIPNILCTCSEGRLIELSKVMRSEKYSTWLKMAIGEGVTHQALRGKISKEEAAGWHIDLMNDYLDIKDANQEAIDLISNLACDCIDLQVVETMETIEKLFAKNLIDPRWAGDLEEITYDMSRPDFLPFLPDDISMIEYYKGQIKFEKIQPHTNYFNSSTTYVREVPKTGRNDLCPCGSGKKFKKCHGIE